MLNKDEGLRKLRLFSFRSYFNSYYEKECDDMLLFLILLFILAILLTITVVAISIGGAAFIIIFGDVIVCMFIIVWIMKLIRKRRRS